MDRDSGTWHHGLVARWWAEFNTPEPDEVAYFRAAIEEFGEPALDLGCGTGRLLLPLLAEGLDVDGSDVSEDMVAHARGQALAMGHAPTLSVQPMHELELARTYRAIFLCGVLGLGGRRDRDREALRRVHRHLVPGGAVLIAHTLPYGHVSEATWARWLPGHRGGTGLDWPAEGDRRRAADGDEIELLNRSLHFDPLEQRRTLQIWARLWHDGRIVREETGQLDESLYFAQEVLGILYEAGFGDVRMDAAYSGRGAAGDDPVIVFVGRKQPARSG